VSEDLSQDEIEVLFDGDGDPGRDAPSRVAGEDGEVGPYDFRRPARISKDRLRSLQAIYGLLAKSLEGWLTGRLRDQVELELQGVEELTFGEFMLALPSPCASFIVDVRGAAGRQGVIDFGHEFAFFLVDRLLGGTGDPALPERSLTPTERLLVRIVADRVAQQLSEVWEDYVRMDLEVSGFESIPEMLQVANREDPVLVANLNVALGSLNSPLLLCLPFSVLEKFFTSTSPRKVLEAQGTEAERRQERRHAEGALRGARLEVGARFQEWRTPLRVLAGLREGTILETPLPTDSKLVIYVSGQRRYAAVPGRVGRRLAVRIEEMLEPEPEELIHSGRGRF